VSEARVNFECDNKTFFSLTLTTIIQIGRSKAESSGRMSKDAPEAKLFNTDAAQQGRRTW